MSSQGMSIDLKGMLEQEAPGGDLAVGNLLRHTMLVDRVLESLTRAQSAAPHDPDLETQIAFFHGARQQMAAINWPDVAEALRRAQPAPEHLAELEDIIERNSRILSLKDQHSEIFVQEDSLCYQLQRLGDCLRRRHLLTHDRMSNETAIPLFRRAVTLNVMLSEELDGYGLGGMLADLADALGARFGYTGQLSDLDEAVAAFRRCMSISPPDKDRRSHLSGLGELLWRRFEVTGSTKDVEAAIEAQMEGSPIGQ